MVPPDADKLFNLKWDNRNQIVASKSFEYYLQNDFSDCLLSAKGNYLACHQLILASSSPYFKNIFSSKLCGSNPVLIFNDIEFEDLVAAMTYVYTGEIKVPESKIVSLTSAMVKLEIANAKGFSQFSQAQCSKEMKSEMMSVDGDNSSDKLEEQQVDFHEMKPLEKTPSNATDIVVLADLLLGSDSLSYKEEMFAQAMATTPVLADEMKAEDELPDTDVATDSPSTLAAATDLTLDETLQNDETSQQSDSPSPDDPADADYSLTDADNSCEMDEVKTPDRKIKRKGLKRGKKKKGRCDPRSPDLPRITIKKFRKQKPADQTLEPENSTIEDTSATSEQVKTSKTKKMKITKPDAFITKVKLEEQADAEVKVRRCKYCGLEIDGSPSTIKLEKKKHQKTCPENPRLQVTHCPFCQTELTQMELNSHVQEKHGMYA